MKGKPELFGAVLEKAVAAGQACLLSGGPPWQRVLLYEERHVCLFNPRLLTGESSGDELTLDDYLRWPHVPLDFAGDLRGVVDERLWPIVFKSVGCAAWNLAATRVAAAHLGLAPQA